jgi:hypothetical protein
MLQHATMFHTTIQHQHNLLQKGHLFSKIYNYSLTTVPATLHIQTYGLGYTCVCISSKVIKALVLCLFHSYASAVLKPAQIHVRINKQEVSDRSYKV